MTSPATTDGLTDLASWVAVDSLLFADAASPFEATAAPGDPHLVLVVGENASGKSLFFRSLTQRFRMGGGVPITLSIRERAGAGSADMSRMAQVMIFGDEAEQSTGATSVKAVTAAFSNLDRPQGTVLGLDEPELGLSDGYAAAMGTYLGEQARTIPDPCAGVVVVTHSRTLVRALIDAYGQRPTFVHVRPAGAAAVGLDGWLDDVESRTVEELLALRDVGLERWRATLRFLEQR